MLRAECHAHASFSPSCAPLPTPPTSNPNRLPHLSKVTLSRSADVTRPQPFFLVHSVSPSDCRVWTVLVTVPLPSVTFPRRSLYSRRQLPSNCPAPQPPSVALPPFRPLVFVQAQSPDETALVTAADHFHFSLKGCPNDTMVLDVEGVEQVWLVLGLRCTCTSMERERVRGNQRCDGQCIVARRPLRDPAA